VSDAVIISEGGALGAPTVGTWHPVVGEGTTLRGGVLLGRLARAGRWVEVTVPAAVSGAARPLAAPGAWVDYGAPLVEIGRGEALAAATVDEPGPAGSVDGLVALEAETDGTVFLCPEPGAAPFVAVGAAVAARDVVALVEVMKTFTPARVAQAGVVERIDVLDGDSVVAGQALMWVRPG
jgi:acetyl-CoA carboxylase biotin carboxyl carrier protein